MSQKFIEREYSLCEELGRKQWKKLYANNRDRVDLHGR